MSRQAAFSLDPFALPDETQGRYRMFIAAAVIFAWSLGSWVVAVPNLYTLNFDLSPKKNHEYQDEHPIPSLGFCV